jgi:eIF3 subunit 6 N terminal domain
MHILCSALFSYCTSNPVSIESFIITSNDPLITCSQIPADIVDKREVVIEKLKELHIAVTPFTSLYEKPDFLAQVKAGRDGAQLLEYMKTNFDVSCVLF